MRIVIASLAIPACLVLLAACDASHDAAYYQNHLSEAKQRVQECKRKLKEADTAEERKALIQNADCRAASHAVSGHQLEKLKKAQAAAIKRAEKANKPKHSMSYWTDKVTQDESSGEDSSGN
jgi:4-alpha-glucanotransferase